jgi:hypothetical protein
MVNVFCIPFGSVYYARAFIPKQNRPSINIVQDGVDSTILSP